MNNKKIDSLFYTNIENYEPVESFFNDLENYAKQGINPVYIVNRPLGEKKYKYNYEKAFVLLIPKHKLIFINYGNNQEAFNDFAEDMIDDLGHLSDRYEYMKVLGRPRQWRKTFTAFYNYCDIEQIPLQDFLKANRLHSREEERKGEFLISLLTGSINDIERTGIDYPDTLLEKIKKKIILFDGDQTRFIFDEPHKDKIIIQ